MNLDRPLVAYRIHDTQVSTVRAERQEVAATEVAWRNLTALGIRTDVATVTAVRRLAQGFPPRLDADERAAARTMLTAARALASRGGADIRGEYRRLARRLAASAPRAVATDARLLVRVIQADPLAPLAAIRNAVTR
jgi:hypothetical protein